MSNVQRIARNTALLLISNVAGFVLGFFQTIAAPLDWSLRQIVIELGF